MPDYKRRCLAAATMILLFYNSSVLFLSYTKHLHLHYLGQNRNRTISYYWNKDTMASGSDKRQHSELSDASSDGPRARQKRELSDVPAEDERAAWKYIHDHQGKWSATPSEGEPSNEAGSREESAAPASRDASVSVHSDNDSCVRCPVCGDSMGGVEDGAEIPSKCNTTDCTGKPKRMRLEGGEWNEVLGSVETG
jgi:hypothetical protein